MKTSMRPFAAIAEGCMTSAQLRSFRRDLLCWYHQNRRDLPWRRDHYPYRVWISEIMLQQTRVAAVLDHYARFLQRFPTVQSLATAREASVLAAWSGLGYYHRARRMHQAAKVIARELDGRFPQTAEEWLALPGIGRYTAAAIASIAFGEAVAVVDGNVERVLQRLGLNQLPRSKQGVGSKQGFGWKQGVGSKQGFGWKRRASARRNDDGMQAALAAAPNGPEALWQYAEALLDRDRPGDFNQAMMELGATICTPRAPQCPVCPLRRFCQSRGASPSPAQTERKRKQLSYAVVRKNASVMLVRRPSNASLMAGMWELPALDPSKLNGDAPLLQLRHSITDTDYRVTVFAIAPEEAEEVALPGRWVTPRQWERLPLTGLARKILRRL
jgi:A/G-specific adenine glycosylase